MSEIEELRRRIMEVLEYDPETGLFRWKVKINPSCKDGWFSGRKDKNDHRTINLFKVRYQAHRIAWLIMTGNWPVEEIDHEDGDGSNNRFENLREATHQQNMQNCKLRKSNKSGVNGICREKGKFVPYISVNSKTKRLGTFLTIEEAISARKKAETELGYHQNHGVNR